MKNQTRIGLAYKAFFESFKPFYPDLEIVNPDRLSEYKLIIFSGGEDISPERYGHDNFYSSTNRTRDDIEFGIMERINEFNRRRTSPNKIKVLGVCRGHQLLHVYYGTVLIQDLYFNKTGHDGRHSLDIIEETPVTKIIGNSVNSLHHQGVLVQNRTSTLRTTAIHKGVIEIAENPSVISVQFHPEWLENNKSVPFFNYIKKWAFDSEDGEESNKVEPPKIAFKPNRIYSGVNTNNNPSVDEFFNRPDASGMWNTRIFTDDEDNG